MLSDKAVRRVVCRARWYHDGSINVPWRMRLRNFGKQTREKKFERLERYSPGSHKSIDPIDLC